MQISENDKNDHHLIINTYERHNISKENFGASISFFISLYFILQKLNDNLMVRWQATLYPLYIFFGFKFLYSFYKVIKTETEESSDEERGIIEFKIKVDNLDRIVLISNFFSLIIVASNITALYYFGEFLDDRKDEYLFSLVYTLLAITVIKFVYSLIRRLSIFSLKREATNNNESRQGLGILSVASTITGPLLTYFSNMMIVCSGSSGVCTQIYMSTIASLLGAFGVSLADFSEYLFPITVVLLGVSIFSLYIKNKKLTHKPFLLGVLSGLLILISHIFEDTQAYYLIYPGNILMIAAAIWNARLNKFYGLPRFNK